MIGCCNKQPGLGQLDPGTVLAINQAFVHAKDLWDDILKIFGVGAGRREADAIVPLQNQITDTVLAPVSAYLDDIHNGVIEPTCSDVKTWQQQLTQTETQWLAFLHNTQWQDGRAAVQAEATLKPYFDGFKSDLKALVTEYCGVTGGIITTPDGKLNWPVLAAGAGILYAVIKK